MDEQFDRTDRVHRIVTWVIRAGLVIVLATAGLAAWLGREPGFDVYENNYAECEPDFFIGTESRPDRCQRDEWYAGTAPSASWTLVLGLVLVALPAIPLLIRPTTRGLRRWAAVILVGLVVVAAGHLGGGDGARGCTAAPERHVAGWQRIYFGYAAVVVIAGPVVLAAIDYLARKASMSKSTSSTRSSTPARRDHDRTRPQA